MRTLLAFVAVALTSLLLSAAPAAAATPVEHGHHCNLGPHGTVCAAVQQTAPGSRRLVARLGLQAGPGVTICNVGTYLEVRNRYHEVRLLVSNISRTCVTSGHANVFTASYDVTATDPAIVCGQDVVIAYANYSVSLYPGRHINVQSVPWSGSTC